jgi:SAM-dependent methyltransferase
MLQLARHSLRILDLIQQYDIFLESIHHVADMGCGAGEDTTWWATLMNNEDPPQPYNFACHAVDTDSSKLAQLPNLKNIHKVNNSFDADYLFPVPVDFIWAHDSLQYSTDPLYTLRKWNGYLNVNGMLALSVPQHTGIEYGRQYSRGYNGCIFHYNPIMLIYMLAVNGFDCRDAYLLKQFQDPWINMAVYKTDVEPMNPKTTTWFDLIDKNLLHPSIVNSINANGFLKQEEIVMPWLDKELYFIDYVSQQTEIPSATADAGVIPGEVVQSSDHTIEQPAATEVKTKTIKPMPLKSKPPTRKSYKND